MSRLGASIEKVRQTSKVEFASRFLFGGAVTVIATLIANRYGPIIGGLFLAFPGIFPPSLSLTESHAEKRKARKGKSGILFARAEASVEAAGASAGALGLAAFAVVLWKGLPYCGLPIMLLADTFVWMIVSTLMWRIREHL